MASSTPLLDNSYEPINTLSVSNENIFKWLRLLFIMFWFVVFIEPILLVIMTRILTTSVYNVIWFGTMTIQPFIAIWFYRKLIVMIKVRME